MFTPDLDLKVVTRCTKFSVQDKTGIDTGSGTKWRGVSGLDPRTLTGATIQVINPSGVANAQVNVLSQIMANVTGTFSTFWFNDITGTNVDGLHNIIYRLKTTQIGITAFSNYSSVVNGTVKATSTGHGLTGGMYIDITGTVRYNGDYLITKISDDEFYFTSPYYTNDLSAVATIELRSTFYPYVYCRSEAGVDNMFANLARLVPGETRGKYAADALTAWGLLMALKSAISSSNTDSMTELQSEIDQILDFFDVDPNL